VWVKTTTDLLGRPVKEEKPGYLTTETTENFYNNKGQLVRQSTADGLQSLFAYDELGNQIRSGLDVNANGVLDLAGLDRITESEMSYVQINNDWWQQTVNRLYTTDNSATPLTTSITRQRLTGFAANTIAETISIDWLGNQTVSTSILDRNNKKVTQTVNVPNSSSDDISISVNGLLVSSQRSTVSAPTLYAYDALGRPTGTTDPRLGTATTHYDSHGWLDFTEDAAGHRTTFGFDSATGRRLSQFNAMTGSTYWAYTSYGKEEKIWGSAVNPVWFEYDAYNRQIKQHTYRSGSGFEGSAWPASAGEGDVTTWTYHEPSGLLTAKTYADGKAVTYTYTGNSKLETRNWARKDGTNDLVTTYSYNSAGDLTGIDYSDPAGSGTSSTPDVSFTSDRLGRQKTASSSVSAHTFAYSGLLLDSETIVSSAGTNVIDRSYDFVGRPVAAALSAVSAPPDYQVAYGYDALGRLNQISNFQFQASYSYLPNSDLLETLSTDNGLLTIRSYEPNRNLLTEIE
ncbi:MAG: hypothetical protein HYV35_07615, partial [Lentisphaerae bacterium]|nr:hypothetical protein [Lentisphaerota bacterium]